MRLSWLFLLLWLCLHSLSAQTPLAIGEWRSHLPFRFGRSVTQSSTKLYYAADVALLELDKSDLSTRYITKVEGLSNAGIQWVRYHPGSDVLAVIYSNSVIDLVRPGGIVTLNQIRNFTNLSGQRQINGTFVAGSAQLYLAASYGVSLINLTRNEFEFTTFTGIPVHAVATLQSRVYAATNEGVYQSPVMGTANIADFNNWTLLGPAQGFPSAYRSTALTVWKGQLVAGVENAIVRWDGNQTTEILHNEPGVNLRFLNGEGNLLLAGYGNCNQFGCNNAKGLYFEPGGGSGQLASFCVSVPNWALEDQQGRVWFADAFNGFRYVNRPNEGCRILEFNTPRAVNNYEIKVRKGEVWVTAGGVDQTFTAIGSRLGFYSFIDGIWNVFTPDNTPALRGDDPNDPNDDLTDFMPLAFHPKENKVYAGSFREGLAEYDGANVRIYTKNNSTLRTAVGDETRTRVGGLVFDKNDNLWVANHRAPRPISVLKKDGTWQSFALSCDQTEIHQAAIDFAGNKWFVSSSSAAGLLVFHEGDLQVNGDEKCRVISQANSNLPTNSTNCITVDLEGDVWVGTTQGVIVFECSDPFNANCTGMLRVVNRNGFNARLLETEDVLCIAVDGADRKWVGTRNGAYLLSPTGAEEILYFNTSNSPLPDNFVRTIGIDHETGEVYFGTLRGIVSYRSDAVEGTRFQVNPIKVFPNPVRPEYDGPISIKGLTRDALVKITDVNGQLVYETQALGGQAIWDGRDFEGRRAQTGVYLVFVVSNPRLAGFDARPERAVAKVLFVN